MKNNTRKITFTAFLVALEIVLQVLGNVVAIQGVSLNLSLLPIIIGAIILGPYVGMGLGFLNGILVIVSPATLGLFMPLTIWGTIFLCLFKGAAAGFLTGLIFDLIKKKNKTFGFLISSGACPLINTFIFSCFSFVFFKDFLNSGVGDSYSSAFAFLIFGVIGLNFVFEFILCLILGPIVCRVLDKQNS